MLLKIIYNACVHHNKENVDPSMVWLNDVFLIVFEQQWRSVAQRNTPQEAPQTSC